MQQLRLLLSPSRDLEVKVVRDIPADPAGLAGVAGAGLDLLLALLRLKGKPPATINALYVRTGLSPL